MSDINFSIAYPEITWDALTVDASEDSNFPARNLFYGGSGSVWKRSGTATSTNITFDLGVSKTSTANYCILRGINNIVAQQGDNYGVSVEVRASTDNFATNVLIASQDPIELVGVKDEDAILLFDTSAAYRYWRVVIKTTSSIQHQLRKLFIGNLFDFNSNAPYYPYRSNYVPTAEPFVSDRGTLFKSSNGRKQKLIEINWRNVLDSTRDFFQARIIEAKDDSPICVIHKDSIHNPLTVYKKPKTLADFKLVAAYLAKPERMFDAVSGGSLPAYGGQIARWETAYGSSHATQATADARPIRSTAPITGVRNLWNASEPTVSTGYFIDNVTFQAGTFGFNGEIVYGDNTVLRRSRRLATELGLVNGQTYTISAFVKMDDNSVPNSGVETFRDFVFEVINGYYLPSVITHIGNDVYRVSRTFTQSGTFAVGITKALGASFSAKTFKASGFQIESGLTATPYQRRITQHEVYEAGVANRDYVWMDGVDDFFAADGLASIFSGTDKPYTIIQVRRQSSIVTGKTGFSFASSSSITPLTYDYTFVGNNRVELYGRGDAGVNSTIHFGTPLSIAPQILSSTYDSSGTKAYKDGEFVSSSGTLRGATTVDIATIGAYRRSDFMSGQGFFNGDYYALLIFDKALTDSDRQYVESLVSEEFSVSSIEAPENTSPNLMTAWVREYDISSGENANLNNISLSLVEDII